MIKSIIIGIIFFGGLLEAKSQILDNTLISQISVYKLDSNIVPYLTLLILNCNSDSSYRKYACGYLFYVQNKDSSFIITIKPIGLSWFYDINFWGVFVLQKHMFYCIGDIPTQILKKDSISTNINYKRRVFQDTSIIIDGLSDLNTKYVIKKIVIKKQLYVFFIQPCMNFSKPTLRKYKLSYN